MRTIKFTLVAMVLCASVVATVAKPKKKNKNNNDQNAITKKAEPVYSVDGNRVVRNANGEVVGKIDVEGRIINEQGYAVGRIPEYSAPNIQEVYSNE